jgi:hypothetical protein
MINPILKTLLALKVGEIFVYQTMTEKRTYQLISIEKDNVKTEIRGEIIWQENN